jgi:hypothetical protein
MHVRDEKYEYVVESRQSKQIVAVFVTKKGIRRRIATNLTNRRSVLASMHIRDEKMNTL